MRAWYAVPSLPLALRPSVLIPVAGENRDAVGIRHANGNRRPFRGEFAKAVVCEQREMRLAGAVVDHTEDTLITVDVGWRSSGNAGRHCAVNEDVVPSADQAAERVTPC